MKGLKQNKTKRNKECLFCFNPPPRKRVSDYSRSTGPRGGCTRPGLSSVPETWVSYYLVMLYTVCLLNSIFEQRKQVFFLFTIFRHRLPNALAIWAAQAQYLKEYSRLLPSPPGSFQGAFGAALL